MKKYEFKINKVPVEINSYLDESNLKKKELINSVLKQTKFRKYTGYGGFLGKSGFKNALNIGIDFDKEIKHKSLNIDNKECINQIKEALEKCDFVLEDKLYIFVFPVFDKFISEKMNGASGFTPYKNVFYVQISPSEDKEKLKESIKHTTAHELGHALSEEHYNFKLSKGLIEEGLNEHFRENTVGGGRDPWTKAISKKKAMKIFNEIKEKGKLEKADLEFYNKLFFGKEYPTWSGYTIGYYLIENYLKNFGKNKIDWNKLFKTPSKEIMDSLKGK